ncbi:MAG: hypothetical protein JWO56_1050, partial [Acidobacteria bacterium]|nr:hypothetical protein [Acidobacteriota bacterium]
MRARLSLFVLALLFLTVTTSFAAVTGYAVNRDGQPIAGASISLYAPETIEASRARLLSGKPQRDALASSASGSSGRFTIEAPKDAPPFVDLRIDAKGFGPSQLRVERDDDLGAIALVPAEPKRGTVSAGGKPVAGATVVWTAGSDEAVATTDADGHYTVPDPAKWANRLTIFHPDHALVEETFGSFEGRRPQLDHALSLGVPLAGKVVGEDGQTPAAKASILVGERALATTAEDGTFTIPHGPVKWETITAVAGPLAGLRARTASGPVVIRLGRAASLIGRVVNAKTQTPLSGAEVRLIRSLSPGRREGVDSAVADAKGNYAFSSLLPGTYSVDLARPGFTGRPVDVTVIAAQKATKNLAAIEDARVSGSVVDEEKRPVAGAVMTSAEVNPDRMAMFAMRFGTGRREGMSAPDGSFVLRAQPDADVRIGAVKKGLPSAKTTAMRLAPGERKGKVLLTIPHGLALTGLVVDPGGKPLSGVAVSAAEAAGGGNFGMVMRRIGPDLGGDHENDLRTGSDGTFTMRLVEGTYDVTFTREGFAAKAVRAQQVNATMKPLEVRMEPGVEITGRVVRGVAGVDGVNINAVGDGGMAGSAVTGPDGSFRLTDLTPGALMLSVRKPDAFVQQMRNVTAPASDVVIDLPVGGRITGRVFDKGTHHPIASFQAGINPSRSVGGRMFSMPPLLRSFTSDDGSFILENVPPGNTQVVVNAPGYAAGRVASLNVEDGKTLTDVEVGLETGTRLSGRITATDGTPISGATVREGDGSPMMRMMQDGATTDPNGDYTIESLEPGEKTFQIAAQGYLNESRTVTLSDRETRLDVQLSSGTKVTGSVVTESGTPVADAEVRAMGTSGTFGGRTARTDTSGSFQFEGFAPGHYTFVALRSPYAQASVRDV